MQLTPILACFNSFLALKRFVRLHTASQKLSLPKLLFLLRCLLFNNLKVFLFVLRVTCSAVSWWWTRSLRPETPWWKCLTTRRKCWSCSTRTVLSKSPPNWSVKNGRKQVGRRGPSPLCKPPPCVPSLKRGRDCSVLGAMICCVQSHAAFLSAWERTERGEETASRGRKAHQD